jgi:hypothetical protein
MSPGSAGLSVRKTARYAGEDRGSLHDKHTSIKIAGPGQLASFFLFPKTIAKSLKSQHFLAIGFVL